MPTIIFHNPKSLVVFHSMCEGMEEVQRDDNELDCAKALERLIEITGAATEYQAYPVVANLPDELVEAAEAVLENCLDNSSGVKPEDEEADDFLFEGEVVIITLP